MLFSAGTWRFVRLATEEEKQKLFDAIELNGYKWNAETKTLEKFVEFFPKFAPKTLQPFDKVLGRNQKSQKWKCQLFSNIRKNTSYPYVCLGYYFRYCIPYNNDTKHLVSTTEEAPKFYR